MGADDPSGKLAPQLPLPILLVGATLSLAVLLLSLRRAGSIQGWFLLCAIWLRVISGAFSTITFAPIAGGLSINALVSVATVGIGVLVIDKRAFGERWAVPIYALVAVMVASAIINRIPGGFIDMFFKWGYAFVLIAATRDAMHRAGPNRILVLAAYCYAPIFVFQFVSVALGLGKDTEGDGGLSYIGGYHHEAGFSIMIATFVIIVYLTTHVAFPLKAALILMGVAGIMLANYRTAIVAVLPLLAGSFLLEGLTRFNRRSRIFVAVLMIPAALAVVVVGYDALAQRFADIGTILYNPDLFTKPPSEFSVDDSRVLSGRLLLWSRYLNGYSIGSDLQLLFGQGPNAWVGVISLYAHNTLVSFLYELGVLGVLNLMTIWATFLVGSLMLRDNYSRLKFLLGQAGFLLFNLATMPHWQIEGMIMFALLQGTLLYNLAPRRGASPAPRRTAPRSAAFGGRGRLLPG